MKLYAKRLHEGEDLKAEIVAFVQANNLKNATVVSAVGSLGKAKLRMAGASPEKQDVREYEGAFEIVSLIGTVDKNGNSHLHISISDQDGNVIGGHLKDSSIVHTTIELVIAADDKLTFERKIDEATGFDELTIQ